MAMVVGPLRWLSPRPPNHCAAPLPPDLPPQLENEFSEAWKAGTVPGWEDRDAGPGGGGADAAPAGALDLDAFDSPDELELLGEDRCRVGTSFGVDVVDV
jgi:hypothetical protein